jgi:hypothetical protein
MSERERISMKPAVAPDATRQGAAPPIVHEVLRSPGRALDAAARASLRCGSSTDFTHYDFPSISTASTLNLAAWAAALYNAPSRSAVTNIQCETEMAAVLTGTAGASGFHAYDRFQKGTGGTETLGSGTALGKDALGSPSFAKTLASVKSDIESQLATQAAGGTPDACKLAVVPPETHFPLTGSDPLALKAVIGGTHGESLNATAFTGDVSTRTYSIDLQFLICDNFGVDEHDLYAPGLFPFWVLQHERDPVKYAPFINLLDLPVKVSGRF